MFSLSEVFAGMGKSRNSKSLLMLCAYPCTVADLELQSSIEISSKQATSLSYPGSSPQGSGTNFCLHPFASIKCPRSLRAALDSAGRNDSVSTPHDPVEVLRSHIEMRKDCEQTF